MEFRTEINIAQSRLQIEHSYKIITIGSCFAENIAEYFKFYRFDVLGNPFGVLYNPASIYNAVKLLNDKKDFQKEDLFKDQDEWHSFFHHSSFSHHDADTCLRRINEGLINTYKFIGDADILIVTFGTSFAYKHLEREIIVSNCHKIPAKQFNRFRLEISDVKQYISSILELLKKINQKLKIIFTVSPVRHWRDGAPENQLSKSILLLAVNDIVNESEDCVYFPSYEIMMDDLRDYRFYEADLIHPNKMATDYIWQKFIDAHLSDECKEVIRQIEPLVKAREHRTRNAASEANKKFIISQLQKIDELANKYPHLKLNKDKEYFSDILKKFNK